MTNISSIDHGRDLRDTVGSVGIRNLHNMLDKHDPNSTFNLNNSIVQGGQNPGAFRKNNNANILGDLAQVNAFDPRGTGRPQQLQLASAQKPGGQMPRRPKQQEITKFQPNPRSEPARFTPNYGAKPTYPKPGPYGGKNTRSSLQPVSRSERTTARAAPHTARSNYLTESMVGRPVANNPGGPRDDNYSLSNSMIGGRMELPKLRRPFKLNRPAGYKPRSRSMKKKEEALDLRGSYLSNMMNKKYNTMPEPEPQVFNPLRNSNPPLVPEPTLQNFGEMRRSNSARHIPVADNRGINVVGDMKLPSLANPRQGNYTPEPRRKRVSFNLDPRTQTSVRNQMPNGNQFTNGIPNILGDGILKPSKTVPIEQSVMKAQVPPPRQEEPKRGAMPLPDVLAGFKMPEMPKRSGLSGLRDITPASRVNNQPPQNQFFNPTQPMGQPNHPRGPNPMQGIPQNQPHMRQPNLGAVSPPPSHAQPVQKQRTPPQVQQAVPYRQPVQQPAPFQQQPPQQRMPQHPPQHPPQQPPQHHHQPPQHQQRIQPPHHPQHQQHPMAEQAPPTYPPQVHHKIQPAPPNHNQSNLDQTVIMDRHHNTLDTTMNPNDASLNFTMDNSFNREDDFLANLNEEEDVLTEEDPDPEEDEDEPREVPISMLIGKRERDDSVTSDQMQSPPKPQRPVIKEKIEPAQVPLVLQEEYKATPEEIMREIERNRPQAYKRVTFREPESSPANRSRFESGLGSISDRPQSILKKDSSFDSTFDRSTLQPSSSKKSLSKMISDVTNDEENGVVVLASSIIGALVLLLIFLVIAQQS